MKRIVLAIAVLMLLLSSGVGLVSQQAAASQPSVSQNTGQVASQPANPAQAQTAPRYGTGGKISLPPPPDTIQPSSGVVDNRKIAPPKSPFTLPVFGTDINVAGGNETSIAANPTNPLNFVGGANVGGRYTTTDGGATWSVGNLSGGGDPAIAFDSTGHAYYAQLGNTSSCPDLPYMYKSNDGGLTWTGPVYPLSDPSPSDHFFDKEWITVDNNPSSPHFGRIYVTASVFYAPNCNLNAYINNREVVAYSDNQGTTWSPTITISDASHDQNQFTNPIAASDGTVYISYQYQNCTYNCNGLPAYNLITKSTNGGVTWSPSITMTGQPISYTGASVAGYQYLYASSINSGFRHNDQAIIGVSPTNPNQLYAVWSDGRFESTFVYQGVTGWHGDIVSTRSTDGGLTWSTPIKVNDDPLQGKDQFFPWMTVGSDGTIHASWSDRRDAAVNGFPYREYYSQSTDGGLTWTPNQAVADVGGTPSSFIGDYSGLAVNSNNSIVIPIWTDMRSGQRAYVDRGLMPLATPTPGGTTPTPIVGTPTATPTQCGASAAWVNKAAIPTLRTRALGAYYPTNGKFYLLGGRSSDSAGSDVLNPTEYNPGTDTWTVKAATFPTNLVNNMGGGVLTISGTLQIIAVGGSAAGGTTASGDVRLYNPTSDTLTTMSSDPWPEGAISNTLPGGFTVFQNKLYILGGFNLTGARSVSNNIWEFDPARAAGSRWLQKSAHLPVALAYVPAATLGTMIYTAGGDTWDGTNLFDTTNSYAYNPVADSITTLANPIPRMTGETRALAYNGEMWVLGGGRTAPNPSNEVDIFNPGSGTWHTGTPFNTARRNAASDTDGTHVYLAGGYDVSGTTLLDSLEVYNPPSSCNTPTPAPPTATATNTPVPPTATRTSTPVPATSTATNTPAPTNTPGGPTNTTAPTNTPVPTNTPGGPTNTPVVPTVTPTDCPNPFVDINGNVFYTAIHYLYCRGVVNGTDITHYSPAGTSTRAQFAKVVVLGFGESLYTPPGGQDFTDVPPSYWAYVYIETGYHNGILSGFDAAGCTAHGATYPCYLPNLAITRGQLTKLVVNAGGYPPYTPTGGIQDFTDVPNTYVFYVSIETAYHAGIINGYPDRTFRPNNNIRRDEMAQIVYEGIIHRP